MSQHAAAELIERQRPRERLTGQIKERRVGKLGRAPADRDIAIQRQLATTECR